MGKEDIDKLVEQQSQAKPISLSLRMGGLYDTRVGATSDSIKDTSDHEDSALALNFNAGGRLFQKDNFALRLDYNGFASFYREYHEYNPIDQTVSIAPQYSFNSLIFSMPLGYNYVLEDTKRDFYRYTAMPTATYLFPGYEHAIALNGLAGRIFDKDDLKSNGIDLDEDGDIYGGGCAYLFYFAKKGRVRLSVDYQHVKYDETEHNYAIYINGNPTVTSQDKRKDDVVLTNLDIQYNLNSYAALYSSYSYIPTHSNVDLYEYNRNVIQVGILVRY